jgi:hypothetical protein
VVSTEGQGARFTVRLPARVQPPKPSAKPAARSLAGGTDEPAESGELVPAGAL